MSDNVIMELTSRFGRVASQQIYVSAALLAAHATARGQGFGGADVRFYFLLFTNWVEHDVLHPAHDLALTQVRRVMHRLVDDGHARRLARGRRPRYELTDVGLERLVEALVDPSPRGPRRPLEASLFVLCFARLYRDALRRRLQLDARAALGRRLARELEPERILARARQRTRDLLDDLEQRSEVGRAMQDALSRAATEEAKVAAVRAAGSYQLERIRPVEEVLAALPDDVRALELAAGPGTRVRLLFHPLAEVLRTELRVLEGLRV